MSVEIERKFLVKGDSWRSLATGKLYRQGYIPTQDGLTTVRVRVVGERGYLTIKAKTEGIRRQEVEYVIPLEDAALMLENARGGDLTGIDRLNRVDLVKSLRTENPPLYRASG